jgi:hypothetical protein
VGPRKGIVRRIDDETREAVVAVTLAAEEEGWEVSRRALAREFGVYRDAMQ